MRLFFSSAVMLFMTLTIHSSQSFAQQCAGRGGSGDYGAGCWSANNCGTQVQGWWDCFSCHINASCNGGNGGGGWGGGGNGGGGNACGNRGGSGDYGAGCWGPNNCGNQVQGWWDCFSCHVDYSCNGGGNNGGGNGGGNTCGDRGGSGNYGAGCWSANNCGNQVQGWWDCFSCHIDNNCNGGGNGGGGGQYGNLNVIQQGQCNSQVCPYNLSWQSNGAAAVVTRQISGQRESVVSCQASSAGYRINIRRSEIDTFRLYESNFCSSNVGQNQTPLAIRQIIGGQN
jgi:hypothetical protein